MVESRSDYLSAELPCPYEYGFAGKGDCAAFRIEGVFPSKGYWLGFATIWKNESAMGEGFRSLAYFEAALAPRGSAIVVSVGAFRSLTYLEAAFVYRCVAIVVSVGGQIRIVEPNFLKPAS